MELEQQLAAAGSGGGGGGDIDAAALQVIFEDIRGIARSWRDNVNIIGDFVNEIREASDAKGLDDTYEALGDTLGGLNDDADQMRSALKQFRATLRSGGDDD